MGFGVFGCFGLGFGFDVMMMLVDGWFPSWFSLRGVGGLCG